MSIIVYSNYILPTFLTGVVAYLGGHTIWNKVVQWVSPSLQNIYHALVPFHQNMMLWVGLIRENLNINEHSILLTSLIYIVSLQLTAVQFAAYVILYTYFHTFIKLTQMGVQIHSILQLPFTATSTAISTFLSKPKEPTSVLIPFTIILITSFLMYNVYKKKKTITVYQNPRHSTRRLMMLAR